MIDSNNVSEDSIQANLLADDSYYEQDSFSNLDQEQKAVYLDKRLSLLMNSETDNFNRKSSQRSNKFSYPDKPLVPKLSLNSVTNAEKQKIIQNEKLLDALDNMDDNLVDESLRFSFTRISLLDIADRSSIIHGPSFRNGKETTERISMRRSSNYLFLIL